eukprot:COSAG05_NODE_393_length_10383_cov_34.037923_3_plen_162_part_00
MKASIVAARAKVETPEADPVDQEKGETTEPKAETQVYEIPRLLEPTQWCPAVPCCILPMNVADDQITVSEDGTVKPKLRLTINPGFAPGFKGKCAPNSLNGQTQLDNQQLFPDIEYFSLKQLAASTQILMLAGQPLWQGATDLEAWFEQLPISESFVPLLE